MKMKIGIGLAALSALAAEGKDFSREALLKEGCLELMDFAAKCLGGCREAARVFSGSPTAPDQMMEESVHKAV